VSLTKKYKYKYLMEKLKFKYIDLKYREEISTNTNPNLIKDEVNFYNEYYYRLDFYSDWLELHRREKCVKNINTNQ
jgi:hypothetical protein